MIKPYLFLVLCAVAACSKTDEQNIEIPQETEVLLTGVPEHGKGGQTLTIKGSGFSAVKSENIVTVNGVVVPVTEAFADSLWVTIPSKLGSGRFAVSVGGKSDTADQDFRYDWIVERVHFAGNGRGYVDGPLSTAKFYQPIGLDFDEAGNLYVADYNNYKIRKIGIDSTVTSLPGVVPSVSDPNGPADFFTLPFDVDVATDGTIYVADYQGRIAMISGNTATIIAGSDSPAYLDGVGLDARFYWPTGIVADGDGNVFIADKDNFRIRKIQVATKEVSTFAGSGQASPQDGKGILASFSQPFGIEREASGHLLVTEPSGRIRRIDTEGNVVNFAGGRSFGQLDGPRLDAELGHPHAIAVDKEGNIFIGLAEGSIKVITKTGWVETVLTPDPANLIYGMAVHPNGDLFVSDTQADVIWKMTIR